MSATQDTLVTDADLIHYMDEALPVDQMVRVESALRASDELRERQARLRQSLDHGWHSVGAIWRSHRLSCPPRSQLGSYLLGTLEPEWQDYVRFHIETIGCRVCQANLDDLRTRSTENTAGVKTRRHRIFQSSAGLLQRER
jgi:hypothetical protein